MNIQGGRPCIFAVTPPALHHRAALAGEAANQRPMLEEGIQARSSRRRLWIDRAVGVRWMLARSLSATGIRALVMVLCKAAAGNCWKGAEVSVCLRAHERPRHQQPTSCVIVAQPHKLLFSPFSFLRLIANFTSSRRKLRVEKRKCAHDL